VSTTDYLRWHDGVEFGPTSQTWRGYIEDNDYTHKHLTDATSWIRETPGAVVGAVLLRKRSSEEGVSVG
jgi:hypothetical protein